MAADHQGHGFKKFPQILQSGPAAVASGWRVRAQGTQRSASRRNRNADKTQRGQLFFRAGEKKVAEVGMLLHERDNDGLPARENLPRHAPARHVGDMGAWLSRAQGKTQVTAFRILNDDMCPQQTQTSFQRFQNIRQSRTQR